MTATWTELWYSFALPGNGWQDYDLHTNAGVPKGAIAHLLMFNANYGGGVTIGVRTDSSSLTRTIPLHMAVTDAYGGNTAAMYVKVDANTGLIETYADDSSVVAFFCTGYWTGIDFTEMASTVTTGNTSAWVDWDVGALGVPDGSVCSVACCNYNTSVQNLGIRINGSSLTRSHTVHSSASTSYASTFTISVKSNATDGIIEYYDTTSINKYLLLGYFSSDMGYQETVWTYPSSGTSYEWTDWDTGGVVPANAVADIMCASARTFSYNIGARTNGSSLERKWEEHNTDGYRSGNCLPTQVDANGIYEIMEYDYGFCRNGPYGYYIPRDTGTEIQWTELFGTLSVTQTGWQSYSLSAHDVPANAVVYIVMANISTSADCDVGVRNTSSTSIDRRIGLARSSSTGGNYVGFWVQVDSSGNISTYTENASNSVFYLMGYLTGTTFTDDFTQCNPDSGIAWTDATCSTAPANRVAHLLGATGSGTTIGTRRVGSTLTRNYNMNATYPVSSGHYNCMTMFVRLNESSQYSGYIANATDSGIWCLGWFGNEVDYAEKDVNLTEPTTGSWQLDTGDVSTYIQNEVLCEILFNSTNTSTSQTFGVRSVSSTANRVLIIHPSYSSATMNSYTNYALANANRNIMLYLSNTTSFVPVLTGYLMARTTQDYRVGTSISTTAIIQSGQRKAFINQSYLWVVYSDGTNLCIASSSDGITWGNKTTIKSSITDASQSACALNGNNLEVAYSDGTSLYYVRITLSSDGTCSVGTERTAVAGSADNACYYPNITIDSNGKALIGYRNTVVEITTTTSTYSPSGYSGTGWTSPANAYADDTSVATCSSRNVNTIWTTFGITGTGTISKVRLRVDGYQASGGDDTVAVAYTVDNSTYTTAATQTLSNSGEATYWYDISSTADTWTKLSNTYFKVRLTTARVGSVMSTQSVDWIAVEVTKSTSTTKYYPKVVKNDNTDGTWSTASGFPYQLSTSTNNNWRVHPQAVTNGKVIVIYGGANTIPYAQRFDGTSTWGSEASTSTATIGGHSISVSPGDSEDVVYVSFKTITTNLGKFIPFTYSTNEFGTMEDIDSSATMTHVALTRVGSNFYVFYVDGTTLYYKKRNAGTWDTNATTWENSINADIGVQSTIVSTDEIVVVYGKDSSTYEIYDKILTIQSQQTTLPFSFCVFVG